MLDISVGIITYNDIANIQNLASYFINYTSELFSIREVIAISTEENSDMVSTLNNIRSACPRFKFVLQKKREGKSSAINVFLKEAGAPYVVLCSGDVYPTHDALEQLIVPFTDRYVGMTGGKLITLAHKHTFVATLDSLVWKLHNEMSLYRPKLGEFVAFRNMVGHLPSEITVDEAYIEYSLVSQGYRLHYVPHAIIYNYGYSSFKTYLQKRIRIHNGHLFLRNHYKYQVTSLYLPYTTRAFLRVIRKEPLLHKLYLIFLAHIEIYARCIARIYFCVSHTKPIWDLPTEKVHVNIVNIIES